MPEDVKAHITGVVFQITSKAGDRVAAGDPVIVLESMKMEIPVEAPRAGVVREIKSPLDLPDPANLSGLAEPYVRTMILTPTEFVGPIMELATSHRGEIGNMRSMFCRMRRLPRQSEVR